jgi:hypothetical protein
MGKHEFEFIPVSKAAELNIPAPRPAKSFYPKWVKEMPHTFINRNNVEAPYANYCMPFTDSFITGYIQELPCDVEFKKELLPDGGYQVIYRWANNFVPVSTRNEKDGSPNFFPKFPGYEHLDFQWMTFWEPKTPPGYSTFYMHPANRFDLPFLTMNGITDTDGWPIGGPIPFLLKEGWEGVIPAGTPIIQMLFIKREDWHSSKGVYDEEWDRGLQYQVRRVFKNGYKKLFWHKKVYL